ncbi:AttM family quorum-quenching N-acyl homoserine lactonase [Rhizobium leguminosarum]|uniref:AttM family quorum-quenching N-acyl homoserine lactonase n=1 Tax=Rhizobium leguminosarum TaxID=384 RepID=UPI001441ECBA|nr:N-acyl homoserine lactonase family protein [Rhizobium leguminosarum]NKL67044.1 MBL fold metallo-hydrolase [Rhizobium leguminosarum bv. viciae]
MTDIRLYMFQTGHIRQKEVNIKLGMSQDEFITPIPWYLITHPKGNVVIDGGIALEAAQDPKAHWGTTADVYYPLLTEEETCIHQLEAAGFKAEDVRYVLHSHLHLDHTGATGRFPNATYVVQRSEYEYAFNADWFSAGGYIRKDFDKPGLNWHFLEGDKTDAFDLYGDGVIKLYTSPGHSPGHQSFVVTLPETGPIMLVIDAAYTLDHWNEKCLPGFLTSAIDTVRSVKKLRMIAEQTGAIVVTGHDLENWKNFKKAPDYYA